MANAGRLFAGIIWIPTVENCKFPFFLRLSYDILLQTGIGSKEKRKII